MGVFRGSKGVFRVSGRDLLLPVAAKVGKNAIQTCGLKIRPRYTLFVIDTISHAFTVHGRCRAV